MTIASLALLQFDPGSGITVIGAIALILIGIFAGIAAMLAAVGLYGVLSYVVAERTRELEGEKRARKAAFEDVDEAALVLEEIGIGDPIPEILKYALPGGCILGEDGRLVPAPSRTS